MIIILSSQISEEFSKKTNFEVISLPPYKKLDAPVSSHADMLISIIDDTLFCYDEYYLENREIFKKIENYYKVVRVEHKCTKIYPNDIALNVLIIGKIIFARLDYTANEIIEYAKKNGYKLVNVSQGYAACSTLVLGNSAITSDISIYNALVSEGINTLFVTTEGITLTGYNCGFIGGAAGVIKDKVYFFGNLKEYLDCDKFSLFLEQNNFKLIEILPTGVFDFGGFKPILNS